MSEILAPTHLDLEDDEMDVVGIEDDVEVNTSKKGMTQYALEAYALHCTSLKEKADAMAVEIEQRQGKIKLIHEILQAINKLSQESGLDISQHPELQEKLRIAKELGVDLADDKVTYTAQERDFLKESLGLAADDFNSENKLQTQKMYVLTQETERWLTLATTAMKEERQGKKRIKIT